MVALSHVLSVSSSLLGSGSRSTDITSSSIPSAPNPTSTLGLGKGGPSLALSTEMSHPATTTWEHSVLPVETYAASSLPGLRDDSQTGDVPDPHTVALQANDADSRLNQTVKAGHRSRLENMIYSMSHSYRPDSCPDCNPRHDPPQSTNPYGTFDDWMFVSSVIGKIVVLVWVCISCKSRWEMKRTWHEIAVDEEPGNSADRALPVPENGGVWTWVTDAALRVAEND